MEMEMEMEDFFGELFDFNSILPADEIYSSLQPCRVLHPTAESTTSVVDQTLNRSTQTIHELLNSSANLKSSAAQEIIISANPSPIPGTVSNYPISNLISFGNSKNNNTNYNDENSTINFSSSLTEDDNYFDQYYHHQDASNGNGIMIFSTQKRGFGAPSRTPVQALDHVVAERKRRQKLGQHFISLSKVVPGLKKLDKASLLEDAIEHLKALKERVNNLEQEEVKRNPIDDDESKDDININGSSSKLSALEIKARIMNKSVLLKIFCKNEKGMMSRIPCELEKMQLCVTDIKVMPFGDAALDITILLEMHSEFRGTLKDIVDHLEMVFLKPCDHLH
ncbi:hypothetical protein RD792_000659 [Penstemon davidsonii]|uniref:BHLH domain-containing protein n=1 Tax=Penstemon davidsonii TaxID=160366 RepID=A0ABR0DLA7_9LAMI|nr:hypothetical protein RD792_000659 [Penstemon davidsonii]